MVKLTISNNDSEQRLDRFLKKYLNHAPLSYIYKLIRKDVKVNGKRVRIDTMLTEGDEIALYISEDEIRAVPSKNQGKTGAKAAVWHCL